MNVKEFCIKDIKERTFIIDKKELKAENIKMVFMDRWLIHSDEYSIHNLADSYKIKINAPTITIEENDVLTVMYKE